MAVSDTEVTTKHFRMPVIISFPEMKHFCRRQDYLEDCDGEILRTGLRKRSVTEKGKTVTEKDDRTKEQV